MAAAETLDGMPNYSTNFSVNSDMEKDVIIRRKTKLMALLSDDEENDEDIGGIKVKKNEISQPRETADLARYRVDKKATNCCDGEIDRFVSGCSNMAEESLHPSSTTEIAVPENLAVDHDVESENIINNINKSIDENTNKSSQSTSQCFFTTVLQAGIATKAETPHPNPNGFATILDSDSEDDRVLYSLANENMSLICDKSQGTLKSSELSVLIDSDSEEPRIYEFKGSLHEGKPVTKPNTMRRKKQPEKKKLTGSIRAAKEEAMREIRSEMQRMLRESQVRLPYHRPKQRTLQEFLNRRKNLPTLSTTMTAAVKVKISGEIVGKVLEEKEKEAELFYKSSSDSDDEGDMLPKFTIGNIKPTPTVIENNIDNIPAIEETQKVARSDLKSTQNVGEGIHQGDTSLCVPRKLYNTSETEAEAHTEIPSPIQENYSETITIKDQDCNQKRKEFEQGFKDSGIPRKLFRSEYVEPLDMDYEQTSTGQNGDDKIDGIQEIRERNNSKPRISNETVQIVENEKMADNLVKNSKGQRIKTMKAKAEYFGLQMSRDLHGMTNDTFLYNNAIPKTSTIEFKAITVTSCISNSDIIESSETEVRTSATTMAGENLTIKNKAKSKTIQLSSMENEQLSFIDNKPSHNNDDSENKIKPIGHIHGLLLSELDENQAKNSRTRIFTDVMRITPKLQGSPDMVIELSPPKVGVHRLIKRFFNHSIVKKMPESSLEITAIHTERAPINLTVQNEVLPYNIPMNEKNNDPELSRPGAKLLRLKEELQQHMAIQRTKEWKQKELEMKLLVADDVHCDELSTWGMTEEDNSDEEKEEKLSDDGESEPDEKDLPMKKAKSKYHSPFVDMEAEVSEEESKEIQDEDFSDEEDIENAGSDYSSYSDNRDQRNEGSGMGANWKNKTQKLKRITKAFQDDESNNAVAQEIDSNVSDTSDDHHIRRTKTDVDTFAIDDNSDDDWLSGTENDLPVYQQQTDDRSQTCETPLALNNTLSIISPITQLTALNTGSDSVSTDLRSTVNPLQLMDTLFAVTTPIEAKCYRECNTEKRKKLQKKLFDDMKETPNDMELMGLCSGLFSENPHDDRGLDRLMNTAKKPNVSDAELLDLCSGTFITQPPDIGELEACSDQVQGALLHSSNSSIPSPEKSIEQSQEPCRTSSTHRVVFSSDEENDMNSSQMKNARGKSLKKKVKKLNLSDDEEDSDNESPSELDDRENGAEKFVDYDSEENEIVIPMKDIEKAAACFLDDEAVLSESEWGSADEDEGDLDKLELEEGDLEDIDQCQVKQQLEKMHMRQVLDADQREVRLLQEILLEDGELHSDNASRKRKFKWKNIDEFGKDNEGHSQTMDEESAFVEPNEADSELEWRKQKLQREQFLKELRVKESAVDVEDEKEDSQLFQLGIKVLKKNKNNRFPRKDVMHTQSTLANEFQTSVMRHTVADLFASPESRKKTFALQNAIHRGSFLARGEESLARLSVITKQNSDQAIIRTNNSRNFVFAHLGPAIKALDHGEESVDQKNTDLADTKFRKRKPALSLTPATSKKLKKEYEQNNATTKLFN